MDIVKHRDYFDPQKVCGEKILIVGAGATGSALALNLAKLGLKDITVMDFDSVELHNLPNQYPYGPEDIGAEKTHALSKRVKELTGIVIKPVREKAGARKLYYEYVFMCVDSMEAREAIFKCCQMNGVTKFVGETRMGASTGAVYAFNPIDPKQVREYKETLYPDSDVKPETGSCGTVLSIGATAQIVAGYLTFMFMHFVKNDLRYNEILFDLPSGEVCKRKFACIDPAML